MLHYTFHSDDIRIFHTASTSTSASTSLPSHGPPNSGIPPSSNDVPQFIIHVDSPTRITISKAYGFIYFAIRGECQTKTNTSARRIWGGRERRRRGGGGGKRGGEGTCEGGGRKSWGGGGIERKHCFWVVMIG